MMRTKRVLVIGNDPRVRTYELLARESGCHVILYTERAASTDFAYDLIIVGSVMELELVPEKPSSGQPLHNRRKTDIKTSPKLLLLDPRTEILSVHGQHLGILPHTYLTCEWAFDPDVMHKRIGGAIRSIDVSSLDPHRSLTEVLILLTSANKYPLVEIKHMTNNYILLDVHAENRVVEVRWVLDSHETLRLNQEHWYAKSLRLYQPQLVAALCGTAVPQSVLKMYRALFPFLYAKFEAVP